MDSRGIRGRSAGRLAVIAAAMLLLAIGCGVPAPACPGVPRFRVAWSRDLRTGVTVRLGPRDGRLG